jgi:hypothetical protein
LKLSFRVINLGHLLFSATRDPHLRMPEPASRSVRSKSSNSGMAIMPFAAAAIFFASSSFADMYKTEKECLTELDASKAKVEMWYASGTDERTMPPQTDFELEMSYDVNKELCALRYVNRLVFWPQWPENSEVYTDELSRRLTESIKLQLERLLPEFPVFLDYRREPPFEAWVSRQVSETSEYPLGRWFVCKSWIAGEPSPKGARTAVRAHHLSCSVDKWKSETLSLVTDDQFEDQCRQALENHIESFVRRYNLLKRR